VISVRAALRVTALPATSPYPGSRREPARARGGPRRPAAARAYRGARGTRRSHAPGGHAGHSRALAVPGRPRCAEPRSRGCVRRGWTARGPSGPRGPRGPWPPQRVRRGPAFPGGRGPVRTPGAGGRSARAGPGPAGFRATVYGGPVMRPGQRAPGELPARVRVPRGP
jgi:hypothetical protein